MLDPDLSHVRTMWDDDGASRHLGIELVSVDHDGRLGRARTRMAVTETMVNGHRIMHGGYIFTFADSTFALVCNAGGELTVAAGCDIDFVRSAALGDVLLAEGVERTRYGRNGITDVTVTREGDGELIAHFRGRSRALKPRPSA
ncbi:hydroxyphenylacetyl-CoA thioesterase PaaI [Arsenicicoccus cauae]|uniref:hydroxyphenylacetyl-CoA thioesterase PaaI n=1 Tax=Arsenicicoccus cauae TaxID=2663847 RepID=UPI001E3D98CA|nr:hydroxyphenylacetyl-CoA thioesterase PaaI [Arsenicicoccus cauae]